MAIPMVLEIVFPPSLVLIAASVLRICGNFYHHCILSKLRTKGGKEYKIPKGGLFEGYVTRKWYMSKFEDLPKEVKAVIPYVF
ncbi:hypothetical protein GOBAR_AA17324 [Gossypium barbadense]|uniref:3-oxo-5-alpha-steroid 4-dehydrogenase C-terminal domain-containing protein n=1 Tax=Gossypium barbadense TaxID=3634 RepID=A0A2P5XJ26_GOSBA|nr:hypothetical protein GOBAR_AA17324 [Gossypium barbadense]